MCVCVCVYAYLFIYIFTYRYIFLCRMIGARTEAGGIVLDFNLKYRNINKHGELLDFEVLVIYIEITFGFIASIHYIYTNILWLKHTSTIYTHS